MRSWVCIFAFAVAVAATTSGCDKKVVDAKRIRISGSVKLDGRDLETGTVVFDPQNGEPPAVMNILDGKYEGMAAVGKNKVMLTAVKKMSMREKMKMDGPGYDTMVEINALPPKYNVQSAITREVVAEGTNVFDFLDLKSQ